MPMSRREFLKAGSATAVALIALGPSGTSRVLAGGEEGDGLGLLIDSTRCIGCGQCVSACAKTNPGPADSSSSGGLTYIRSYTSTRNGKEVKGTVKIQCMHCAEPACASACPVGAIRKTKEGPVVYDPTICLGCRYCMMACPFGIPAYNWESTAPQIRKCTMCYHSVQYGGKTACSIACPTGAVTFGRQAALIAEAEKRMAAEPGKYIHYLYGLEEAGGTSVYYLSGVPFEDMGFRTDISQKPLPEYTWQAMSKIPGVVSFLAFFLTGATLYTSRRNRVEKETGKDRGNEK